MPPRGCLCRPWADRMVHGVRPDHPSPGVVFFPSLTQLPHHMSPVRCREHFGLDLRT